MMHSNKAKIILVIWERETHKQGIMYPAQRDRMLRHYGRATLKGGYMGFLGGSAGKESACSTGDLSLIPGLGRFPGGE